MAAAALEAGADMINDHTGLTDGDLAAAVAEHGGGLVVTHLGLAPKQVQAGRYEIDPADDRQRSCRSVPSWRVDAGIDRSALVVDPGLGFGKSTATDLATLRALPDLLRLGYPLLLACSHKEVTAEPLGLPESNIEGTAAVVAVAAYQGVQLLRVHDLPFMARVATMAALLGSRRRALTPRSGLRRRQVGRELRQEPAVAVDQLAVGVDLAAGAQVADHVPVQPGAVRAAGLGIAGADRHVARAADLLVEQDLLGEVLTS